MDFAPRVAQWNTELAVAVRKFQTEREDINAVIYDSNALFNKVLDNPTIYGFDNADDMCEEKCIWFNGFHPGSVFYKVLAKDFAQYVI